MAPPFLQICSQLLNAIREALRRLLSSISHCANSLYCPLLPFIKNDPKPRHLAAEEQEAAWRLLKQLESPGQTESTNVQHLRSLTTLASSQDPSVQLPAAMCLLAFSQADPIQALPKELIPALHSLLQSLEQEVQIYACCTLSNLLQRNLVSVDEILTEDTTKALLESLESSDSALQNAACCCLVQLLPLPGCSKVMVDSGAVIPLLVLAKGYEPRVQLAAVTALRTLATSSWGRTALQEDGAFPILVLLLQSSDPELQYSSSGALAALSVDHACRISLLNLGDRLLLKSLIQLTSSPVEKVCCQACSCLQVLATEDHVQKHLISPVTLQELHSLFSSSSCTIQHAALSLLHSLSCNPTSKETLLAHGLVQTLCEVILENQLTAFSTGLAANMLEHLTEPSSLRLILRAQGPEALLQAVDKLQTFSDCESSMALVLCALASLLKFDAVQRYVPPTFVSHSVQLLLCIRAAYSCPHVRLHARNALLYLTQECRAESLGSFLPGVVDTLEVLLTEHKLHSQELALLILTSLTPDPFVRHSINQGSLSHPVRELSAELDKVRDLVASLLTRCQSPSPTPSPGAGLDPSPGAGLDPSPGAGLDPSPGAGLDPSPGAGLDPSPGAGLDPSPGAGLDPSPGAGLDPS